MIELGNGFYFIANDEQFNTAAEFELNKYSLRTVLGARDMPIKYPVLISFYHSLGYVDWNILTEEMLEKVK